MTSFTATATATSLSVPFVGSDVIFTLWSVSAGARVFGSEKPRSNIAAVKLNWVSSSTGPGEMGDTTGGCSTRVTVGPPPFGSAVSTLAKLLPLTVP
jgi:hypothetical protein